VEKYRTTILSRFSNERLRFAFDTVYLNRKDGGHWTSVSRYNHTNAAGIVTVARLATFATLKDRSHRAFGINNHGTSYANDQPIRRLIAPATLVLGSRPT